MEYRFRPRGVCSSEIIIDIDGTTVKDVKFIGGCNGNGKGVGALCRGRDAQEIIDVLKGTTCGFKSTSCPDQLSKALEEYLKNK
ncbi:MAG: TIGR03905 family TSCPD domain-containing protein [Clostridia bacterium]|nr:TIGR03905 family TSCPD domain-containing protein [Clostridia bacterium]